MSSWGDRRRSAGRLLDVDPACVKHQLSMQPTPDGLGWNCTYVLLTVGLRGAHARPQACLAWYPLRDLWDRAEFPKKPDPHAWWWASIPRRKPTETLRNESHQYRIW